MYLRSHKGAAKGWYEQKREAVGGGGGLARSRKDNVVVVVVVGGSFYSIRVKDKKRGTPEQQKGCNDNTTTSSSSSSCRSSDLAELVRLLLSRSKSFGRKICESKKKRKNVSRLVCLERGMSEGERSATTPRIGWRKLTDPGD
ncbi:hypothetical protein KPH14_003356 [Odynerus spinipes]|uniref:Uncharacterized protein n=1 Tax=Odynerus spinipes TaxID=1348599 RepID=A0AAD9RDV1_9HYME|nr:hypothetical protein KPH14_003356 [Odynerus spinipes]